MTKNVWRIKWFLCFHINKSCIQTELKNVKNTWHFTWHVYSEQPAVRWALKSHRLGSYRLSITAATCVTHTLDTDSSICIHARPISVHSHRLFSPEKRRSTSVLHFTCPLISSLLETSIRSEITKRAVDYYFSESVYCRYIQISRDNPVVGKLIRLVVSKWMIWSRILGIKK